uniref:Proton-translocating NAD(P)(+) transhydrogenase n=1 Tax=Macrostomum lignano TaxID=282301 RepID=A0A1I8IZF7_9PLAT
GGGRTHLGAAHLGGHRSSFLPGRGAGRSAQVRGGRKDIMLITSSIGVVVNMIMAVTLHQHGHTPRRRFCALARWRRRRRATRAHQTPSHTEPSSRASTPVSGSSEWD